jgi:uncharacterized protein
VKPVRIVIFAKAPVPGFAKTRLIPALGPEGAAALAARLLAHALVQAQAARVGPVTLCMTPAPDDPAWSGVPLPEGIILTAQGEGDLGARMARVAERVTAAGEAILLIGTDCPGLTAERLREAALVLASSDAVMIPAMDGGYTLLGLSRFDAAVFKDIAWSTASVAQETRQRIKALGWSLWEGAPLPDIDEPGDLRFLPEGWLLP